MKKNKPPNQKKIMNKLPQEWGSLYLHIIGILSLSPAKDPRESDVQA